MVSPVTKPAASHLFSETIAFLGNSCLEEKVQIILALLLKFIAEH